MHQVQSTLKQLTAESEAVSKRFLKETNNRVLRPQELPQAETSAEDKQQQMLLAKQTVASPLDCPVGGLAVYCKRNRRILLLLSNSYSHALL